jgi:hypothetical protein
MRARLALLIALLCVPAAAHSPYDGFFSGGAPGVGRWCCNGNLEGTAGDCSPAEYKMNADGSAFFWPKQHPGKAILVPAHRIIWGGPPDKEAMKFEAHWCGLPRAPTQLPDADDPDPEFITFCASLWPGGV